MSTAELAPTREHRPVITPVNGSPVNGVPANGAPVNGAPANGVPVKRGEQPRDGPSRAGTPADTATDLLEEFAAIVAHELRTPLAIVELAADTVLERSDQLEPDQLAGMLRIIKRNTRLANLMLGRLELARGVRAGAVHLQRELVDLAEIARQTGSDLADVLLKGHPTEVHAPAAVMTHADPTAVREILSNLLSNAAKYSPQGSYIDVTVAQDQHEASITVRDRGCGLTAADAQRVFDKYQQAGPDASGGGLGLYVSRGLARAHGGDLDVHPATARGSEFRLTLPNTAET